MTDGTPVEQWIKVPDVPVLIYVVHENAQYEPDEAKRLERWEGWHVGAWTTFNGGGWTWHGMLGMITHVAPLPGRPGSGTAPLKCPACGKDSNKTHECRREDGCPFKVRIP